MDTHLFVVIIHIVGLVLVGLAVLFRSMPIWMNARDQSEFSAPKKIWIALQHLGFTVLVVSGIVLLYLNNFQIQTWFYAKIILFLVMLSALNKAFKKDQSILLVQRRAGLVIGCVAFVAVLGLVIIKPVFS
ncbi:SirB2 family protein [Acinetobacter sp. S40]|uniref:SirB2 family protein n=1 Tax=unclassified Acinetobacter TaxID=196816 RepID=UPI00190A3C46|nr:MULTISPECIES: SirB2 family protein [unclassified Acinetobacter]MBJ9986975.1 SirB2 family protein [Acinetobacter sp. S40]MBK0065241.1 SirB2 family protein [Acinetobacter sp. S55]MBK0068198.1 SirB2 family protein [Acinetobacter sp. S54]